MPRGVYQNHATASQQHRWRAGSQIASNGYVKVRVGRGHPLADPNGYAYEHAVVWCAAGNPRPPKGYAIHHRNHDKTDNRIENLELLRRGQHNAIHNVERGQDPNTGRFLGKKAAGRLLDGIEHNGMPEARP
jgi:HNH endonuclease